jgi:hypothetical protein
MTGGTQGGPFSYDDGTAAGSPFNAMAFVFDQLASGMATAALVQVQAVTNTGGVIPAGFVDVLPLVNQIDGVGNATPHGTLHSLPYCRVQAGTNAVILDPVVGDIGIAAFCSRDISSVKVGQAQANPGSRRKFDMADGVYLFGVQGIAAPTQYVAFSSTGIAIVSPTAISLTAPAISLTATGAITLMSATLTHNGKNVGATHEHGGVMSGGGNTGVPI